VKNAIFLSVFAKIKYKIIIYPCFLNMRLIIKLPFLIPGQSNHTTVSGCFKKALKKLFDLIFPVPV
jgi:hypothetical protein